MLKLNWQKRKLSNYQKLWGALIICLGLYWMYSLYNAIALPFTFHLRFLNPERTAYMTYYNGSDSVRQEWVDMGEISPYLRQAVVMAEDGHFYEHSGFDWEAIKEAARVNWQRKELAHGASTITQQLARNLYLSPSKNPFRKLKEFLIALKLERELSKERILELYLNIVEWGNGIYGAQAAAQHYFGSTARYLDKSQAAFLAAILPKPRYYEKHRGSNLLQQRIAFIESHL